MVVIEGGGWRLHRGVSPAVREGPEVEASTCCGTGPIVNLTRPTEHETWREVVQTGGGRSLQWIRM